jgi:RTX calcium-binding nonapeptide repeat (4 copies)
MRLSLIGTVAAVFVLATAMPADSFAAPPANDNFADAQPLDDIDGTVHATNVEATKEPGEPAHAGNPGGASIWFRWTAPWRGHMTVWADFEFSLLAVYTGASVDALSEVAASYGTVEFTVVRGTQYAIAVDGVDGQTGSFDVGWWFEFDNDDFRDARPISGVSGEVYSCSGGPLYEDCDAATREPGEPWHGVRSRWFRWTAPRTAWFRFHAYGAWCEADGLYCAETDTILAVYRGTHLTSLKRVAYNDNFADVWKTPYYWIDWFSALSFRAVAGVTYRISLAETPDSDSGWDASLSWVPGRIMLGGPGNDVLAGTPYSDYIKGAGGNDVISGKRGADILVGGPGVDVLYGGSSNDRLHGHWPRTEYDSAMPQGRDRLIGGFGWDHVRAGREDRIYSSERIEYGCRLCDWED